MNAPRSDRRLALLLATPAAVAMAALVGWPLVQTAWISLHRHDLRFPDDRAWVGLANYADVLTSPLWWRALANTLTLTAVSVGLELVLGVAIALVLDRGLRGRLAGHERRRRPGQAALRSAVLVPYGIVTVVAALAWRLAFDPTVGFVDALVGLEGRTVLATRPGAILAIVAAEVWKTTPFVALLVLAGLVLVPDEILAAARLDGAGAWRRLVHVTLPLVRPAILVALLFRTMDAWRIFDTVFVLTRGAQGTETLSILAYRQLLVRLNLGVGGAVSVLTFVTAAALAALYLKALGGTALGGAER